jgi:polyisoprenoid-binding protein YceI
MDMSTAATTPASATQTTWTIDPAHSHVEFAVRHLMISTVKGRFGVVTGTVKTDDTDPAKGEVEVSIDAASIDTREAQRDAHLRSGDFFDVEKFPSMTFRSTRIEGRGDSFKVIGDLAIRGVSRPVVLDVTAEGLGKDPWGGDRAGFSATAKIKRSDFGLTWNQLLETGGVAVGDEIKISIDVELVKQQ